MRLQHVGITVAPEAVELARGFYRDLLALPELYASERALVYGLGRAGDLELHVVAGTPANASAQHHFALEVDDLESARARLAEGGTRSSRRVPSAAVSASSSATPSAI